ncbi:hypothetical protein D3C86_1660430 [compost metagenome]
MVSAIAASTSAALDTSHTSPECPVPSCAAISLTGSDASATMTTLAPASAYAFAQAKPIPAEPPVRKITLPDNNCILSFFD